MINARPALPWKPLTMARSRAPSLDFPAPRIAPAPHFRRTAAEAPEEWFRENALQSSRNRFLSQEKHRVRGATLSRPPNGVAARVTGNSAAHNQRRRRTQTRRRKVAQPNLKTSSPPDSLARLSQASGSQNIKAIGIWAQLLTPALQDQSSFNDLTARQARAFGDLAFCPNTSADLRQSGFQSRTPPRRASGPRALWRCWRADKNAPPIVLRQDR